MRGATNASYLMTMPDAKAAVTEIERRLAVLAKISDVLSFVVPVWLVGMAVYWYVRHRLGSAVFSAAIATLNVYTTRRINRRAAQRAAEIQRRIAELEAEIAREAEP